MGFTRYLSCDCATSGVLKDWLGARILHELVWRCRGLHFGSVNFAAHSTTKKPWPAIADRKTRTYIEPRLQFGCAAHDGNGLKTRFEVAMEFEAESDSDAPCGC
jgi:hypothetical protein